MCIDSRAVQLRCRVRGQALIELLVACLVLLPLLAAGMMLARYEHVAGAADTLARMVSQECAVRGVSCAADQAGTSLRWQYRLFGPLDTPIESLRAEPTIDSWRVPLWVDMQQRPLITQAQDVSLAIQEDSLDAGEAVARSQSVQAPEQLAHAGPSRFGLQSREGLVVVRASVNARLADVSPWRTLGLPDMRFTARAAAIIDAWNASGVFGNEPSRFEFHLSQGKDPFDLQAASSVFGSGDASEPSDTRYLQTRSLLQAARARGLEPSAGEFTFSEFDLEIIPHDRLEVAP